MKVTNAGGLQVCFAMLSFTNNQTLNRDILESQVKEPNFNSDLSVILSSFCY